MLDAADRSARRQVGLEGSGDAQEGSGLSQDRIPFEDLGLEDDVHEAGCDGAAKRWRMALHLEAAACVELGGILNVSGSAGRVVASEATHVIPITRWARPTDSEAGSAMSQGIWRRGFSSVMFAACLPRCHRIASSAMRREVPRPHRMNVGRLR